MRNWTIEVNGTRRTEEKEAQEGAFTSRGEEGKGNNGNEDVVDRMTKWDDNCQPQDYLLWFEEMLSQRKSHQNCGRRN